MLMQNIPNPDYMNGTLGIDNTPIGRFALESGLSEYGDDASSLGMGTTGSLGVSMYAPYTRGGFPGELFDSHPMPTGHWKDAPTPVMLGTEEGGLSPLTKVVLFAGLAYAVWQLFDLGGGSQPAAAPARRAVRPALRTRRIALANK